MPHSLDTWTPRRAAVIGAGAMGASLAAVLGQSLHVVIVAREAHRAEAIRTHGVEIRGIASTRAHPTVVRSIAHLPTAGALDAVFVATKTWSIDQVSEELRPIIGSLGVPGEPPFIVSFQNGIEPARRLIEQLHMPRVLRMVLNYGARLASDGTVELVFSHPPHYVGCLDPAFRPVCHAIARVLSAGGMEAVDVDDIEPLVWTKGILNAAMNPVAALLNCSVGEVLDSPARAIVGRLLDEGLCVAQAECIDLGPDARARMRAALEEARPHTPSMVEDIREGRPSEVGQLNRQIIAHAARVGVPTPDHQLVTDLIDAFDWRVFRRTNSPDLNPIREARW